ncbi:MAG: ubiquinone/menaquinone biosynthesis methyltransferase [Deltaproteobacteria bacterium]|nr:ubiquinone/menaquinone biosynthesis methyltransferase [Deltaproteobacteria bacterium]
MSYRHPTAEEKAGFVQQKFDQIASHYDRFNDLITQGQHRWWKRVLVRRLGISPQARGLDLCCGTGDIAARVMPLLGTEGTLVAADFSPGMLRIAHQRLMSRPGAVRPLILTADAMRLPFQDGTLDFITIGYGLRNVRDLKGCLRELMRVLAPGGVLASLDVGRVRPRLLRPLAEFYLFQLVPRIGRLLQPGQDMFTYLPHSTLSYPHQDALKELLLEAAFTRVELVEFLFGASVIHLAHKDGG